MSIALTRIDLTKSASRCLWVLLEYEITGFCESPRGTSVSEFERRTGLDIRLIKSALKSLREKKIIIKCGMDSDGSSIYRVSREVEELRLIRCGLRKPEDLEV